MKLAEESIVEDMSSFAPVESYSKSNTPLSNNSSATGTPEKPSRVVTSGSADTNSKETEVIRPVPSPRKNKPSPIMSRKQEEEKVALTVAELSNVDSGSSFSSAHSDEGNVSDDVAVTTMADVINEFSTNKQQPENEVDVTENGDDGFLKVKNDTGTECSSLKRNKTLKWSGSRRAPALIREFTRRQKTRHLTVDSENLGSPNKEVESVLLSNTIMVSL